MKTFLKLIIFDYSGTLSLEAPRFAGPESLMNHLEAAGLRDFGIASPRIFWEQLVNPTWSAGSTTGAGYKKVLLDRIIAVLQPDVAGHRRTALAGAVSAFVDRYLSHSRIDARWEPVLQNILAAPSIRTVIATDHYAEATGAIIHFLGEWNLKAAPVIHPARVPETQSIIVANSADMGVHKADPHFWQIVKTNLRLDDVSHILIIDDFGYNEHAADAYSHRHKVDARMKATVRTLKTVFPADVEVFPFMVDTDEKGRDVRLETRIAEAQAAVARRLASR